MGDALSDARRAMARLRLEVPGAVWDDVNAKVCAVVDEHERMAEQLALCAADTSYAELRQEVEFLRATVAHERERWDARSASESRNDVRVGEVIATLERIAGEIPGGDRG